MSDRQALSESERQRKYRESLEKAYKTKVDDFAEFLDQIGVSSDCPRCQSRMFIMPSVDDEDLCAVSIRVREQVPSSGEEALMPIFMAACTRCGFVAEHFAAAYMFAAGIDADNGNDAGNAPS